MANKEPLAGEYVPLRLGAGAPAPRAPEQEYLQIGEVADLTGLTQRTLRYYEELQLLDPPSRMAGGFRLYSPADVARVQHIVRLKQLLGYSLAEIKQILSVEEDSRGGRAESGLSSARRLERIESAVAGTRAQLDLLQRKIAEMELLREELATRLRRLEERRGTLRVEHERAQLHAASEYS